MADTQVVVTIAHVIESKMCVRGTKNWMEHHGLDFRKFLADGYPVETIEATGDALGLRVCDVARKATQGEA